MQPIRKYEVIDEDLAHVFYTGPSAAEAETMRYVIVLMGHKARVVTVAMLLLLMFGGLSRADVDYNPPITQADDTASEMGRQNDEYNQRILERENAIWQEEQQARKDREIEERLEKFEKEKNDNSRNVY